MTDNSSGRGPTLPRPGQVQRRPVSAAPATPVATRQLFDDHTLPLLITPTAEAGPMDIFAWVEAQRPVLEQALERHGGILFRGFGLEGAADLQRFIQAVAGEALEYRERSSPRSAVEGRIYTSTDYPPQYPIFLHNENSYQSIWPLKVFFFCQTPAALGGETPIADCRQVLARLDPEVRRRFADKGWMYVRNFGDGFGLDWPQVFQTSDRDAVTEHCRKSGIAVEWKDGNRLRTRAVRPALARHPRTGEELWFNHCTFFHVSTLAADIREELLAIFDEEDLPTNTFYGDGTPIEPDVLAHLRSAYDQSTLRFPWQKGDLLLLDNMLVAHGRAPYQGERKILVGMAEPIERAREAT